MDGQRQQETSMETRPEYEAPAVEQVVERDELGRELLYAGQPQISSREF